ncbi:gamma-glutamyltransferase [Mycobacterium sp. KBS0706]|uniref:gamma-glutamyltransferase n=1 Tax=Mycobacterium sp. KBS0706 TaxID=2578109 RepID=UPI00110F6EAE|nr:gamma-glutamyltransferase [Mycobacterium sp. KBS0706]TSD86523.1 gamma-glutamyltransferase [Mycobacterium sp. KBS0706]
MRRTGWWVVFLCGAVGAGLLFVAVDALWPEPSPPPGAAPVVASQDVAAGPVEPAVRPEPSPPGGPAPVVASPAAAVRPAEPAVRAKRFMVAAADPVAARAGYDALAENGTAVDAMIAVQLVLNLVEPQSGGIGGGALLLYFDGRSGRLTSLDGLEAAPRGADANMFLGPDGQPISLAAAAIGGRSVGAPGTLKLLLQAHQRWGRLSLARLFRPAIDLAEKGFTVSPRLAGLLTGDTAERLKRDPRARDYFFPGGQALQAGQTLRNPAFADTLRFILGAGDGPFYLGPIGADIVGAAQGAPGNAGRLAPIDLEVYRVVERQPVCVPYRVWRVCGMGPPSAGGIGVGQILGMLEHLRMPTTGPGSGDAWHLFAEAGKLATADRDRYVADPDFILVPTSSLIDGTYTTARARMISADKAVPVPAPPGNPPRRVGQERSVDTSTEPSNTSHISFVDADGSVVSLTTSIEGAFGSHLMVRGFLLNNGLADFSFAPYAGGRAVANRVEPGKRPRTSMAPTIVLDQAGRPVLVIGTPGGARIIPYVAQAIIGVLDWGLDVQQAIDLGHVVNLNGRTELEAGTAAAGLKDVLAARGHDVVVMEQPSGLQGIQIGPDGLVGGSDSRRGGVAVGR